MISDRLFKFADFIFPISAYLGALPYTWDPKTHRVIRSSHSRFYNQIHFFHLSVVFILDILQLLYFYYVERNLNNFNLMFVTQLCLALILQLWYLMIYLEDDAITTCNSTVFYLQFINKKYLPSYDPNNSQLSKIVEVSLMCIFIGHCAACVITCIAVCLYPHSPFFIMYSVPLDAPSSFKLPVCYLLPCIYFSLIFLNTFDCIAGFFGYGVFIVPFVVRELRMGRASYKSVPELREPENLILAYRTIQVYQLQAVSVMGQFLLPSQTIITKLVIFASYMAIKHGHEMEALARAVIISWSALGMVFWVCILAMGGYLHFQGNKVLLSWKYYPWPNSNEKKLMHKFRRSCKTLQLNYGTAYVIKKMSVLKFLRSLSRGILRVLLTL